MPTKRTAAPLMLPALMQTTLAVVLTLLASAAPAQVFECTNAKGQKEYAQYCAPGTVQQREVVKAGEIAPGVTGAGEPAAQKSLDQRDIEFRKRQLERQEAETRSADEKAKAEIAASNCLGARAQLRAIQDGQRMSRIDPDTGERIQFGDEERAAENERMLKVVEQWCKQ